MRNTIILRQMRDWRLTGQQGWRVILAFIGHMADTNRILIFITAVERWMVELYSSPHLHHEHVLLRHMGQQGH